MCLHMQDYKVLRFEMFPLDGAEATDQKAAVIRKHPRVVEAFGDKRLYCHAQTNAPPDRSWYTCSPEPGKPAPVAGEDIGYVHLRFEESFDPLRGKVLKPLRLTGHRLPGTGPSGDNPEIARCIEQSEKEWKGACPGKLRPCVDDETERAERLTLISCYERKGARWVETTEKSAHRHKAMIMFIASRAKDGGVDCWFASKAEWKTMDESVAERVKKWAGCTNIREDDWF
jgi:hypothetical protein